MLVHLVAGLMDGFERGARKLELAAGLQATGWVMCVISVLGVAMAVVMGRHRQATGTIGDAAAAAAAHTHTLPTTATPVAAGDEGR